MKRLLLLMASIMFCFLTIPAAIVSASGEQPAMWFMDDLKFTQLPGGDYSHAGTLNFDVVGVNNSNIKAPFDCEIAAVFPGYNTGNTVIIQSTSPVLYANGTVDYMSMAFGHDNDISDCWVGRKISRGEVFCQTGNYGNVTGVHSHVTCIAGKYTDHPGWLTVSTGNSTFRNGIHPVDALFVSNTTNIYNSMGLSFVTYGDTVPPTTASLNINHTRFTVNQPVSLTYSSDTATDYFLHVYHKGGSEIECVQVTSSGADTYQFTSSGEYTLYIGASNQNGAVASNSVDLTVVDARKPSTAELAAIAPICEAGTYARFTYYSDTATHFYLHVFDSDMREIECVDAPASGRGAYLLSNPGKYSFYVGVANNYGDLASNLVTVNCLPSTAPQTAEMQTSGTAVKGSSLAIHYTSDTAVEFYLHVSDESKQEIECISLSSSGSDEYKFENAGLYTLYIGAANSKGSIASNSVDVVVLSSEEDVLSLPSGIVLIDVSAFEGCGAKQIILPEGIRTIEDYAFSNCAKLELIEIPETVEAIGEHAFDGSDNVIFAAPARSYAYEYAQEHGIACARR